MHPPLVDCAGLLAGFGSKASSQISKLGANIASTENLDSSNSLVNDVKNDHAAVNIQLDIAVRRTI